MWWLIALRGLRRGEAAGLRWIDVDLAAGVVMICQQRITYGSVTVDGPPKTAASRRTIALDRTTVVLLREHLRRQGAQARAAGTRPPAYVFTDMAGQPLNPDYLARRFKSLVDASGLPPVRLHDLRHGAATLGKGGWCGPEDRAGVPRTHLDRADRRYLHQRANADAVHDGRGGRPAGPRRRGGEPRASPQTPAWTRSVRVRSAKRGVSPTTRAAQAKPASAQGQEGPHTYDTRKTHENQDRIARWLYGLLSGGAPPGTRTPNPRIKSRCFYVWMSHSVLQHADVSGFGATPVRLVLAYDAWVWDV